MRMVWATDLHLDSVELADVDRFCWDLLASQAEAVLLSGDIATSDCIVSFLRFLELRLRIPIYYVLGNHDYYGSRVADVRTAIGGLRRKRLVYLPDAGTVELSPHVSLVGHDGWGDCRVGNLEDFEILNDYLVIGDLYETLDTIGVRSGQFDREPLRRKLAELGDEAADTLGPHLVSAAKRAESVLVVTHVPPFREACWHAGTISEDTWLPGFTCKAVGDLLSSVARQHPATAFTELCGHTHGSGYVQMGPNLEVYTGFGHYGSLHVGFVELDGARVRVEPPEG